MVVTRFVAPGGIVVGVAAGYSAIAEDG